MKNVEYIDVSNMKAKEIPIVMKAVSEYIKKHTKEHYIFEKMTHKDLKKLEVEFSKIASLHLGLNCRVHIVNADEPMEVSIMEAV